jgi:hypothetical protein
VPQGVPEFPSIKDYWQQDYDNIAGAVFDYAPDTQGLPAICYSETYQRYLTLPANTKELIEWFVSFPTYLSQTYYRNQAFPRCQGSCRLSEMESGVGWGRKVDYRDETLLSRT